MSKYKKDEWTVNGVDLSPHMMALSGADYLKVPGRVLLFRSYHPQGTIHTDLVQLDLERGFAMFRATITDGEGHILAVDYGTETLKGFPGGYIEKASTVSVGRALAAAGFGTAFAAADFHDDAEHKLADAPAKTSRKADTLGDDAVVATTKTQPVSLTGIHDAIKTEAIRAGWSPQRLSDHVFTEFKVYKVSKLALDKAQALLLDLKAIPDADPEYRAHAEAAFADLLQKAS